MMKNWPRITLPLALGLAFLAPAVGAQAQTASSTPTLPPGLYFTTQDTGVQTNAGKAITFPIDVMNMTNRTQLVQLKVLAAPKDWDPVFQDRGYNVNLVQLLPGKDNIVTFQVTPPSSTPAGTSNISLQATSDDGLTAKLELTVDITKSATGGVKLTTDYPILQGSSGSKFEFKTTVANNTGKDQTFGLSQTGPQGWIISFQPGFEQKQVSSISVKAGATQDVNVEVQSATTAKPGDYPVNVKVSDDAGDSASVELKVTLIGSYKLDITTPTQQLNTTAEAGKDKKLQIIVQNTGSAPVQNISLSGTNMPSGWTMKFTPDKLDSIDPNTVRQVDATLTPAAKAIAGDYSISISATSTNASVNKDFRVTVQTPTIWGWVGIGIVVVVLGGLYWLFQTYSRR